MPDLPHAFLRRPLAHRGLHDHASGRIENSRAAFDAAIAAGYGIELDVQRAACGTAMVFHDDALDRLTGRSGRLRDCAARLLGRTTLAGSGETIPTLPEILARVAGRAPLLIEVKDQDGALGTGVGALEARVTQDLADYQGPVALMSFNPNSVAALAEGAPDTPRGLVACAFRDPIWNLRQERRIRLAALADFERTQSSFVAHDHQDLGNPDLVRRRAAGVPVLCWTIRSSTEEAVARQRADNITFEGYNPTITD